ncbi:hypothetical protein GE21DRAFT_1215932, partial [Neurospora crassa]
LAEYVFKTIPEPSKVDTDKYNAWWTKRANANKILIFTFKNPDVGVIRNINSWDRTGRDPKVMYNFIQSYIARIIKEVRSEVLAEYLAIKRANFNTIISFFNCYTIFRKCIKNTKFTIDGNFEVTFLYNTIKIVYLIDVRYWAAASEVNKLDILRLVGTRSVMIVLS